LAAKGTKRSDSYAAFVSYSQADKDAAEEIADGLEARGFKCWIAPRNVRPGRSYGDEIIRGIESARCLILVLSNASNESAFVAREIERAVSKKKPVFPIRIENVVPSPSLEFFISSTQWIDAYAGKLDAHIDRLARLLGDEEGIEPSANPIPKPARRLASPLVLGIGAATALAAVAVGILWLWSPAGDQTFNHHACLNLEGEIALKGCNEAIASGAFEGAKAADLYAMRGYQRHLKDDLPGALSDYGEAIRLDPRLVMAFNNRGNIYLDTGQYDEALADYDRALALNPNKPDPLASRGWIYHQKGEGERARKDFEKALALDPDDSLKAKLKDALAEVEKSDPDYEACETRSGDAAIAACDRAIESGKFSGANLAYLYNDRGYLRMIGGDLIQGFADFSRAIQLDPDNYYPYWNRAELMRHRGDLESARADYQTALALNPKSEDRQKIEAALGGLAEAARRADPEVISDPSVFRRSGGEAAAAMPVSPSAPADSAPAMPAGPAGAEP